MTSTTTTAQYNWCFASKRDSFVSGSARPGNSMTGRSRPPGGGPPGPQKAVTEGEVEEWAAYMKEQGVKRVLCLLTGSELLAYKEGGLLAFLRSHFNDVVTVSDLYVQGAGERIFSALMEAFKTKEHCVIHCSAGQGRTGNCLALWLHKMYNLPVEDAVEEVASFADSCGAVRRPTTDAVNRMLGAKELNNNERRNIGGGVGLNGSSGSSGSGNGNSSGVSSKRSPPPQRLPPEGIPPRTARGSHTPRLSMGTSYGSKIASSTNSDDGVTPRSSRPLPKPRIAFVQTGGTIDKEYPQSTKGYAFEIAGDCPAARRVLKDASHVPLGFHAEFHEVCRKDSTELTNQDRAMLVSTLVNDVIQTNRIIVTHGSDTIIETADFLSRDERLANKVIVLTGSMRPQKFRDTDAAFNIGVAVGAVNILPPGVYVAMCGAVISHERCRRDMKTGAFVTIP